MQKIKSNLYWTLLLAGCLFLLCSSYFLTGCKQPTKKNTTTAVQNGKLIKAEKVGEFDTTKLNSILNEELEQFMGTSTMPYSELKGKFQTPANSVTLYKITYQSSIPDKANAPSELTGLVAIPSRIAAENPMVSYQHGTVFAKDEVPSNIDKSMETKLMLAQFGGQGYIVIAADYEGVGDSKNDNSYFNRHSTERACLDMYAAAQEFLGQQNIQVGNFFVMGWSQGAYNTLLFLRSLELAKIPVVAATTAATPADPLYFVTHGILNPRPNDAPWIPAAFSVLLHSYESYLGLTDLPAKAIRPEYLQTAKDFYSFKIGFMDFLQKTPASVLDFLNPEFIEEMRLGSSPLCAALTAAEGYRWKSNVPIRTYYGEKDEAIPEDLGKLVIEYQTSLGKKDGEAVNAGANADHHAAYAVAIIGAKPWFDSFLKK
jgi:pimeloyl-ACP methyl ester carboxylesterase